MESRPLLATPHATSKLQRFEDLYSAEHATLGFRGEALFALSTLCPELLVLTRTEDEPLAQKLVYNGQGILMPQFTEFAPRKRGTTVAAVRLFEALPVRRIDLQRRLPAQKARLLRLLQHYAVMCVGVELHYRIYDTRKREITLLHTPPRTKSLKDTIAVAGRTGPSSFDTHTTNDKMEPPARFFPLWRPDGLFVRGVGVTTTITTGS